MSRSTPAAGGGRWVTVTPERLERWLAGFEERHGLTTRVGTTWTAADGSVAEVEVPFPPLTGDLVAHVLRVRTVGVLLVRRGGYAAGVFRGSELVTSKVGSRHVQGRTAAGGWSQQRFARRRDNQADVAAGAAAVVAERLLVGADLDALRIGGDRTMVEQVLADRRLATLGPLVTGILIDVPDPRLAVLRGVKVRDLRLLVTDPPPPAAGPTRPSLST